MGRTWCLITIVLSTAAVGCIDAADSDTEPVGFSEITGTEGSCELLEEVELALDEDAPIRLSGDDILLRAEGLHLSTLSYPDGTSLPVEVTVTYSSGDVIFYDRDLVGSPDVDVVEACFDAVEVAVIIDITSDDGVIDAQGLQVHLVGLVENESSWDAVLDPGDLGGTYEITEVDPAAFDSIQLVVEGTFVTQGSGGVISGIGTLGEETETFDVAEWVPPGQEG